MVVLAVAPAVPLVAIKSQNAQVSLGREFMDFTRYFRFFSTSKIFGSTNIFAGCQP